MSTRRPHAARGEIISLLLLWAFAGGSVFAFNDADGPIARNGTTGYVRCGTGVCYTTMEYFQFTRSPPSVSFGVFGFQHVCSLQSENEDDTLHPNMLVLTSVSHTTPCVWLTLFVSGDRALLGHMRVPLGSRWRTLRFSNVEHVDTSLLSLLPQLGVQELSRMILYGKDMDRLSVDAFSPPRQSEGGPAALVASGPLIEPWIDCYPGSTMLHAEIFVVVDYAAVERYGRNAPTATREVAAILARVKEIYTKQPRVELHFYVQIAQYGERDYSTFNFDQQSCPDSMRDVYNSFAKWSNDYEATSSRKKYAAYHLITGCSYGSHKGLGAMGGLCGYSTKVAVSALSFDDVDYSVVTIAHEIGHNAGMSHAFDDAGRGGLMDYGDGKLDDAYQFQPAFRRHEMCSHLRRVLSTQTYNCLWRSGSVAGGGSNAVCEFQDANNALMPVSWVCDGIFDSKSGDDELLPHSDCEHPPREEPPPCPHKTVDQGHYCEIADPARPDESRCRKDFLPDIKDNIPRCSTRKDSDGRLSMDPDHIKECRLCDHGIDTYDVVCPPGSRRTNNITSQRAACTFDVDLSPFHAAHRHTVEAYCLHSADRDFYFWFGWPSDVGRDACTMLSDHPRVESHMISSGSRCKMDLKKYGGLREIETDCDVKSPTDARLSFSWRTGARRPNQCWVNRCLNGGVCTSLEPHGFACQCAAGYEGLQCERKVSAASRPHGVCASDPSVCGDHGTCHQATGECICDAGIVGRTCCARASRQRHRTNGPCDINLCQNGGACREDPSNFPYHFTCDCVPPFTGTFCQTNDVTVDTTGGDGGRSGREPRSAANEDATRVVFDTPDCERSSQLIACLPGAEWAFYPGKREIGCRFKLDMRALPNTRMEDCRYPRDYLAFTWSENTEQEADLCERAFISPDVPQQGSLAAQGYCEIRLDDFPYPNNSVISSTCDLRKEGYLEYRFQVATCLFGYVSNAGSTPDEPLCKLCPNGRIADGTGCSECPMGWVAVKEGGAVAPTVCKTPLPDSDEGDDGDQSHEAVPARTTIIIVVLAILACIAVSWACFVTKRRRSRNVTLHGTTQRDKYERQISRVSTAESVVDMQQGRRCSMCPPCCSNVFNRFCGIFRSRLRRDSSLSWSATLQYNDPGEAIIGWPSEGTAGTSHKSEGEQPEGEHPEGELHMQNPMTARSFMSGHRASPRRPLPPSAVPPRLSRFPPSSQTQGEGPQATKAPPPVPAHIRAESVNVAKLQRNVPPPARPSTAAPRPGRPVRTAPPGSYGSGHTLKPPQTAGLPSRPPPPTAGLTSRPPTAGLPLRPLTGATPSQPARPPALTSARTFPADAASMRSRAPPRPPSRPRGARGFQASLPAPGARASLHKVPGTASNGRKPPPPKAPSSYQGGSLPPASRFRGALPPGPSTGRSSRPAAPTAAAAAGHPNPPGSSQNGASNSWTPMTFGASAYRSASLGHSSRNRVAPAPKLPKTLGRSAATGSQGDNTPTFAMLRNTIVQRLSVSPRAAPSAFNPHQAPSKPTTSGSNAPYSGLSAATNTPLGRAAPSAVSKKWPPVSTGAQVAKQVSPPKRASGPRPPPPRRPCRPPVNGGRRAPGAPPVGGTAGRPSLPFGGQVRRGPRPPPARRAAAAAAGHTPRLGAPIRSALPKPPPPPNASRRLW